jgi:hypothetical protein
MNTGFSVLMRAFVLAEKKRLELNIFPHEIGIYNKVPTY